MCEERVGVVGVDGDECVVGLAKPEEDRFPMNEGRKCILLEIVSITTTVQSPSRCQVSRRMEE